MNNHINVSDIELKAAGWHWQEIQQMFNASCGWANDNTASKVWEMIELGEYICRSFGWS